MFDPASMRQGEFLNHEQCNNIGEGKKKANKAKKIGDIHETFTSSVCFILTRDREYKTNSCEIPSNESHQKLCKKNCVRQW